MKHQPAKARLVIFWPVLALSVLMVFSSGCQSSGPMLENIKSAMLPSLGASEQEIEKHRERFQTQRDSKAMDWLLGNAINSGMSRSEVERGTG